MEETIYHQKADPMLAKLLELAEKLEESHDIEVELDSGVLTVTMPNKRQYVINKHTPSRQIWVSSPKTGAAYFEWNGADWILKRSTASDVKNELFSFIEDEFIGYLA